MAWSGGFGRRSTPKLWMPRSQSSRPACDDAHHAAIPGRSGATLQFQKIAQPIDAVFTTRPNVRCAALPGKKSWPFAVSERCADRAAARATLITTAKLNDIDPLAWLADVLGSIAGILQGRLHDLLPALGIKTHGVKSRRRSGSLTVTSGCGPKFNPAHGELSDAIAVAQYGRPVPLCGYASAGVVIYSSIRCTERAETTHF